MSFHSKVESPRTAKRARVLMKGALILQSGTQEVRLRDISCTGAHLVGVRGLEQGLDLVFQRGPIFAPARISWLKGDEAGLTFYRELEPEEVDGHLPAELLEDC